MKKKELILSEDQARRLWERAARLQAEASKKEEAAQGDSGAGGPRRELIAGVEDESAGYSLTHIKEAGEEIGDYSFQRVGEARPWRLFPGNRGACQGV